MNNNNNNNNKITSKQKLIITRIAGVGYFLWAMKQLIFYSDFFISPPPNTCGTRPKRLREQAKTNRLPPRQISSQLTDFFKISPNPPRSSGAWRHPHSVSPLPKWVIVTSLSDSFAPPAHARKHLCWCCTLVTHALSRKVLSLTKPKGMKRNPSAIILQYEKLHKCTQGANVLNK